MNCYDCQHNGHRTAAIAVCHDCGAALCHEHTAEGAYQLTVVRATSWKTPLSRHSAASAATPAPPQSQPPPT